MRVTTYTGWTYVGKRGYVSREPKVILSREKPSSEVVPKGKRLAKIELRVVQGKVQEPAWVGRDLGG